MIGRIVPGGCTVWKTTRALRERGCHMKKIVILSDPSEEDVIKKSVALHKLKRQMTEVLK